MLIAAGDVTGLHLSWRMCLDRLPVFVPVGLDADLRPANSPALRIFDLGHGEEIRAPGPGPPVVPVLHREKENIQGFNRI